MKDLDFDELDQAVSSVLGGDKPNDDKTTASNVSPTTSVDTTVMAAAPVSTSPETPVASRPAAPAVSPAVRRRGQFLDMVHPSADMTSRTVTPPAARRRIAPVSNDLPIAPTSEEKAQQSAAMTAVESESNSSIATSKTDDTAPAQSTSAPVTPASMVAETLPVNTPPEKSNIAWPDPLDLTPAPAPEPAVVETPPVVASTPTEIPAAPEETPTPAEPVAVTDTSSTPFVTDAKVDKRPLGAFGTPDASESTGTATETPPTPAKTDADEQRPPDVTRPELQPDVVSVESADREFAPEPEPEEPISQDNNSGLSQSIPQQYRTPAPETEHAPHPIFDTDEYHQPLLPAPHQKKKRGWVVVLIIVALLIVGAALGYFAYTAGL